MCDMWMHECCTWILDNSIEVLKHIPITFLYFLFHFDGFYYLLALTNFKNSFAKHTNSFLTIAKIIRFQLPIIRGWYTKKIILSIKRTRFVFITFICKSKSISIYVSIGKWKNQRKSVSTTPLYNSKCFSNGKEVTQFMESIIWMEWNETADMKTQS